jgi:hypothetical protein
MPGAFAGPVASQERRRCDAADTSAEIVAVDSRRVAGFLPVDLFTGFMDRTREHRLRPGAADAEFDERLRIQPKRRVAELDRRRADRLRQPRRPVEPMGRSTRGAPEDCAGSGQQVRSDGYSLGRVKVHVGEAIGSRAQ